MGFAFEKGDLPQKTRLSEVSGVGGKSQVREQKTLSLEKRDEFGRGEVWFRLAWLGLVGLGWVRFGFVCSFVCLWVVVC